MHIKPSQLPEALCLTLPDSPVMIWGAPGVGKSQIIHDSVEDIFEAVASARGVGLPAGLSPANRRAQAPVLWERRINDYDLLDFAGLPHIVDGVQVRALPDIWPGVGDRNPVYGVLFLDEFPQGAREKQTAVQRLLDARSGRGRAGWQPPVGSCQLARHGHPDRVPDGPFHARA